MGADESGKSVHIHAREKPLIPMSLNTPEDPYIGWP